MQDGIVLLIKVERERKLNLIASLRSLSESPSFAFSLCSNPTKEKSFELKVKREAAELQLSTTDSERCRHFLSVLVKQWKNPKNVSKIKEAFSWTYEEFF